MSSYYTFKADFFLLLLLQLILKATKAFDVLKDWYSAEDPTSGSRAGKGKGC